MNQQTEFYVHHEYVKNKITKICNVAPYSSRDHF